MAATAPTANGLDVIAPQSYVVIECANQNRFLLKVDSKSKFRHGKLYDAASLADSKILPVNVPLKPRNCSGGTPNALGSNGSVRSRT